MAGVVVGAVGFEPFNGCVGINFDGPFTFVNESMMEVTEHHTIIDIRLAAEFPPFHMMGFGCRRWPGTTRISTSTIAVFEGTTLMLREGPRGSILVEGDRVTSVGDDRDLTVARHTSNRVPRE